MWGLCFYCDKFVDCRLIDDVVAGESLEPPQRNRREIVFGGSRSWRLGVASSKLGGVVLANVEIVLFGAGGFGREVAWLIAEINAHSPMAKACFVGRGDEVGREVHGVAVLTAPEAYKRFPNAYVICTSGSGAIREAMTQEAVAAG